MVGSLEFMCSRVHAWLPSESFRLGDRRPACRARLSEAATEQRRRSRPGSEAVFGGGFDVVGACADVAVARREKFDHAGELDEGEAAVEVRVGGMAMGCWVWRARGPVVMAGSGAQHRRRHEERLGLGRSNRSWSARKAAQLGRREMRSPPDRVDQLFRHGGRNARIPEEKNSGSARDTECRVEPSAAVRSKKFLQRIGKKTIQSVQITGLPSNAGLAQLRSIPPPMLIHHKDSHGTSVRSGDHKRMKLRARSRLRPRI
jgi:hypothetical protein